MHAPVLVTPPATTPVSLAEAKLQLSVDAANTEYDTLITGYIAAAVDHLDGWSGILGRCLVTQTWRQDFDGFAGCLRLPLAPVIAVTSIVTTDSEGAETTLSDTMYSDQTDALGPFVRLNSTFEAPSSLAETKAVSVTFTAGYATVPPAIKAAILIHVRLMFDAYRLGKDAGPIPTDAIDALITPFRRVFF